MGRRLDSTLLIEEVCIVILDKIPTPSLNHVVERHHERGTAKTSCVLMSY